jgi:predicted dehydrogenase
MSVYRVAQVGVGNRGMIHIEGFLALPDLYELVAVCDIDEKRMEERLSGKGIAKTYTDAEKMLAETKPDVFCFVTPPDVRLPMVRLAAKYGVKGVAFEKPMARSLQEAAEIRDLCHEHHIKAVVSHQQKYLTSLQRVRRVVVSGEIGQIMHIEAHCQAWLSQLGTHYIDYIIWVNGGSKANWVVGHTHGPGKLSDNHPSPDYILGHLEFENGVRATIQCGYLAPSYMSKQSFWVDNRLTVFGTHGYVWGDTEGRFGAFTKNSGGEVISESGPGYDPAKPHSGWSTQETTTLQPAYLREFADWLDDETKPHSCNVDISYHGYQLLEGLCISALDNTRVDLPLDPRKCADINSRLRRELPVVPALAEPRYLR